MGRRGTQRDKPRNMGEEEGMNTYLVRLTMVLASLAAVVIHPSPANGGSASRRYLPPWVEVAPGAQVNAREVQKAVAAIASDPRGWGRDLDHLTIRIVVAGTYGTAPDNGQPGIGGLAPIAPNTAGISDRYWNKLGRMDERLGATLVQQRAWFVNHEIGHLLGYGHKECDGSGPAPVMRSATFMVGGCDWNAWPHTKR